MREVASLHPHQPTRDGAGVALRRALGHRALRNLDPFLLLDEMRSDDPADFIKGFPRHPHRGFETVSYVLSGAFEHGDTLGNRGTIGAGAVQWMTAGRGIVHEEMPRAANGQLLWGFQLWVNLPAVEKMRPPRYQEIGASSIPTLTLDDAQVRLVAGQTGARRGPVDDVSVEPTMLDATLEPGARWRHSLDGEHTAFVYVLEGAVEVGEAQRPVQEGEAAVLGRGDTLLVRAAQGGRLLAFAGRPLREPVARSGPFVMNTQAELQQAWADYRSGRLVQP